MNKPSDKEIARDIVDSAWRNEIDTHGLDAAHVTADLVIDYAEGRDDWRTFSNPKRARILKHAAAML